MLHDYHFYAAPRMIRAAHPEVTLQQFVHIPWPQPQQWQTLPDAMVRDICDGLLANDTVAFQTDEDVENFLATCRAYLGSAGPGLGAPRRNRVPRPQHDRLVEPDLR